MMNRILLSLGLLSLLLTAGALAAPAPQDASSQPDTITAVEARTAEVGRPERELQDGLG